MTKGERCERTSSFESDLPFPVIAFHGMEFRMVGQVARMRSAAPSGEGSGEMRVAQIRRPPSETAVANDQLPELPHEVEVFSRRATHVDFWLPFIEMLVVIVRPLIAHDMQLVESFVGHDLFDLI